MSHEGDDRRTSFDRKMCDQVRSQQDISSQATLTDFSFFEAVFFFVVDPRQDPFGMIFHEKIKELSPIGHCNQLEARSRSWGIVAVLSVCRAKS